jgi:DNA replication protein DnaC
MSTNYIKLCNNLDNLNLTAFKANLDNYLNLINTNEVDIVEALYQLTSFELNLKKERARTALIKVASFPYLKTFDDYDFEFQPSLNKLAVLDLKNLRFIENKENVLFIGSPGTGKTHLATAIGMEAALNGYSTYFISCHDLILQLKKAFLENRLEQRLKHFTSYTILIIDEVGYLPLDTEASSLLFQLIAKRYEKKPTILTTNKSLNKWGEVFGDVVLANAILDRLLHHSQLFLITGRSYRTKDVIFVEEKK